MAGVTKLRLRQGTIWINLIASTSIVEGWYRKVIWWWNWNRLRIISDQIELSSLGLLFITEDISYILIWYIAICTFYMLNYFFFAYYISFIYFLVSSFLCMFFWYNKEYLYFISIIHPFWYYNICIYIEISFERFNGFYLLL